MEGRTKRAHHRFARGVLADLPLRRPLRTVRRVEHQHAGVDYGRDPGRQASHRLRLASIGRFAQSGLIRERFAPRLLAASEADLLDEAGTNFDPFRAWRVVMTNEKPGGHGERCVAVGALDMALWDAAAK